MSKFLSECCLVIVLNDLKYMLSYYMLGMQGAMIEDLTISQEKSMAVAKQASEQGTVPYGPMAGVSRRN